MLLGPDGKPIPTPAGAKSGLFCAYNAGTTIVTISAGGLSASLPVTVQAGSVRRPCGTIQLKELPVQRTAAGAGRRPAPAPTPAGSAPASAPPPLVPLPPAPTVPAKPMHAPPAPLLIPFATNPRAAGDRSRRRCRHRRARRRRAARLAVTPPVEAPEKEEEEEEATESVGNSAVAYRQSEHETPPAYLLGLILLATFAGASTRRRPRRGERELRVAPATVTATRWQRSASQRGRSSRLR